VIFKLRIKSHEGAESGLLLTRLDLLPRQAERLDDALDRPLKGLVQHLFPVDLELVGDLIGVLEADHVGIAFELSV